MKKSHADFNMITAISLIVVIVVSMAAASHYGLFSSLGSGGGGDITINNGSGSSDSGVWNGTLGLNPLGKVSNMFTTGTYTITPSGSTSTPPNDSACRVQGCSVFLTVSGGSGVNVTCTDWDGNVFFVDASTLTRELIPRGYKVIFTYTSAPTVIAFFN